MSGVARHLVALAALAACACAPEIGSGTYWCGPEELCPPDLECDGPTHTCVIDSVADPFTCPAGSEMFEPDDDTATARALGDTTCGQPLLSVAPGCIDEGADVDVYMFEIDNACSGSDPHVEVRLRYPIARLPLVLELIDDQGAVMDTGELCTTSSDFSGTDARCLDIPDVPGVYYLRIAPEAESPDCDGACRFNDYTLSISSLLS